MTFTELNNLNTLIAQLQDLVASLQTLSSDISTGYATKLQWKQLDTVRAKDIEDLKDRVTELEEGDPPPDATIDALREDLDSVYVSKTQWKQLDTVRAKDIQDIKAAIETINNNIAIINTQLQ